MERGFSVKTKLFRLLDQSFPEMIRIRRHLHMHPEVSFQEFQTAKFIYTFYKERGIEVEANVGGNGVVARVKGAHPGKCIALRADFDALPIQDEKDVPYRSTVPGVMHACGHDGHTATLLQVAATLHAVRQELTGEYVFIHQHAEELAPGGAFSMIEAGCLEGVDAIFGAHLWSPLPTGTIEYRVGPIMAAADRFEIVVQGAGGHGAAPHETKDAIVIASQLVLQLQQIVSRRVDPIEAAVLTIGSFVSGNAFNIIADSATLNGTVRTFNPQLRDVMEVEIKRIANGVAIANDCTIHVNYRRGYPALVNHLNETLHVKQVAQQIPDIEHVIEANPQMAGEDFAYYVEKVPGSFFFVGARPETVAYPHHHPKFNIDEKAMLLAAKTLVAAAIDYQPQ